MPRSKDDRPLRVERVPLDALVLDPANARRHPEKNLEAIRGSLARFGQVHPIVVDGNGVVRIGNGRVEAMRTLGWEYADVIRVEHLSETELAALAVADNRTAELAEWDDHALGSVLQALQREEFDLSALGFDASEVDALVERIGSESVLDLGDRDEAEGFAEGEQFRDGDALIVIDCPAALRDNEEMKSDLSMFAEKWGTRWRFRAGK